VTSGVGIFWDSLSADEAEFAQSIMLELHDPPWAAPLLAGIRDNGGVTQANKDRMFELRFGHALDRAGIVPQYEIPGEGQSTIDFGFANDGQHWRVEMVRLGETQAVKDATGSRVDADGVPWSGRILRSDADDPKQSLEGETLKAVERICQKCESKGRRHKFPPLDGAYHGMLVDLRTFSQGGDIHDRVHIALGAAAVDQRYRLFWDGRPIMGVFSPETKLQGAAGMRERVHFLGFVHERTFRPREFAAATQFIANPHLFANAAAARSAIATWPLQPAHLINGAD
jgi:hypothetical protein